MLTRTMSRRKAIWYKFVSSQYACAQCVHVPWFNHQCDAGFRREGGLLGTPSELFILKCHFNCNKLLLFESSIKIRVNITAECIDYRGQEKKQNKKGIEVKTEMRTVDFSPHDSSKGHWFNYKSLVSQSYILTQALGLFLFPREEWVQHLLSWLLVASLAKHPLWILLCCESRCMMKASQDLSIWFN